MSFNDAVCSVNMADPHLGKLESSHVASWSNNIEMFENEPGLRGDNPNFLRSSSETAELLQMAALNGTNNFAIFLISKDPSSTTVLANPDRC